VPTRWTLAALSLSSAMTSLTVAALVIALPTIHREFDVTANGLQWTLNGYSIAYTATLVFAGRLGDLFGRRALFLSGTALYGAASVFTAFSRSIPWLVAGVTFVALGAAALTPAALSIIRNSFPEERRGRAIAMWGGASTLLSGIAPAIGGLLTDDLDWRWIFGVNAIVAAIVLALGLLAVPDSRDESAGRHIDVGGLVCLAPALVLLSVALIEGGDTIGWASVTMGLMFAAVLLLVVALVLVERHVSVPLIDFALFRRRAYTGATAIAFVFNFALTALFFLAPFYMQEVMGFSAVKTGLLMLPLSLALACMLFLSPLVVAKYDPRLPLFAGLAVTAVGLFLFSGISRSTTYGDLLPALIIIGLGLGISLTPRNTYAMNAAPAGKAGAAAGIVSTVGGLAATLGVSVSGLLFEELRASRISQLLANTGPHLTRSQLHHTEGLLVRTKTAATAISNLSGAEVQRVVHAARDAFAVAIGGAMRLSAVLAAAGLVFAGIVMRGRLHVADDDK
jgi:EmrB/QacA subfamily drug resistance transporter